MNTHKGKPYFVADIKVRASWKLRKLWHVVRTCGQSRAVGIASLTVVFILSAPHT